MVHLCRRSFVGATYKTTIEGTLKKYLELVAAGHRLGNSQEELAR